MYRPNGKRELIIISYNNNQWSIKRHSIGSGPYGRMIVVSTFDTTELRHLIIRPFEILMDTLRNNSAFLFPDESEIPEKHEIMDGSLYIISFKLGDKFR